MSYIQEMKEKYGDKLLILAHHYQNDSIIQYADFVGDSLKLAQYASQNKKAEYIVFCGVYFMAETADILTEDYQKVLLPEKNALCKMAQMAKIEDVVECYDSLKRLINEDIIPITYVNSTAAIKAFCGEYGGATMTSSNADKVMEWAYKQNKKILFLPDKNLGKNTALKLGIKENEIALYDYVNKKLSYNGDINDIKIVLWNGYCYIHDNIKIEHINDMRSKYSDIKVIVHPECKNEVVKASDFNGSTEFIINKIKNSDEKVWAVGTEKNLVNRIKNNMKDKEIHLLYENCFCYNMSLINEENLEKTLRNIEQNNFENQVIVDKKIADKAIIALENMLNNV